jgi:hypothetical protein
MRTVPCVLLAAAIGCGGPTVNADRAVETALGDRSALARLAEKRVYFAHQSVGMNIFEGLEALERTGPALGLRFVDARVEGAYEQPAFGHAPVGRNHAPLAKIQDFADALEKRGLGGRTDIALYKFCYVDFPPGAPVEEVFAAYKASHARLRAAFPAVTLVHVTAPLTVVQSGPKALVKRLVGRPLGGAEANATRERFNDLLRAEYGGREPLFDLAELEATRPDGRPVRFEHAGRTWRALAPEYASDGKHLNALGSRWVAAHLLRTLAAADR